MKGFRNHVEITISNHPDGTHIFPGNSEFSKDQITNASTTLTLSDFEWVLPVSGLSYTVDSVTINGTSQSLTGPWDLSAYSYPADHGHI